MMSILVLAAMAALAVPQSAPLPGLSGSGTVVTNQPRAGMRQYAAQVERDMVERNRREQNEHSLLLAQRERATRLAAMANAGQCPQAIQIARDEGDAAMAERLSAACSRISTAAPTTAPPQ